MAGNKGFADLVARSEAGEGRAPPRTGILAGRANGLARLAAGNLVTRQHELVEPNCCRIWDGHNRHYEALDTANCADLLESLKAQGRQEVPAIVRRVTGTPGIDFEVICGARRHWSISWLRTHDYPEFLFLVEPRELTDEEAFRLADLENRHRKDLSDYERAMDYARAIERYYGGSQQRMVERLDVSKSWLSRYLELEKLPEPVLEAFGNPHLLGIKHAAILAPLLRAPGTRDSVLAEAKIVAEEQRAAAGQALAVASVVRRLVNASSIRGSRRPAPPMITVRGVRNDLTAQGRRARGGTLELLVSPGAEWEPDEVLAVLADLLRKMQLSAAARGRRRVKSATPA